MRLVERYNILYPARAVLGPMVIAGVSIDAENEIELKKIGVKDSKELSPARREELSKKIEQIATDILIVKVDACKIDSYKKEGINLNMLESMRFADILNFLKPDKAFIDSPDVNTERLKAFLSKLVGGQMELVVEHHADKTYPVVSAASIVAKVSRDAEVVKLREKYGVRGSGYPADPETVAWLKEWLTKHKNFPDCVRHSWSTIEEIEKEKRQSKLSGWIDRIKGQ